MLDAVLVRRAGCSLITYGTAHMRPYLPSTFMYQPNLPLNTREPLERSAAISREAIE